MLQPSNRKPKGKSVSFGAEAEIVLSHKRKKKIKQVLRKPSEKV